MKMNWKFHICDYLMTDNAVVKTIHNDTKGPTGVSFIDDAIHCDITILIYFHSSIRPKKGNMVSNEFNTFTKMTAVISNTVNYKSFILVI